MVQRTRLAELIDFYRKSERSRFSAPVSYTVVAKRAKISRQYLYDLMHGVYTPSDHVLARLSSVLGLPEEYRRWRARAVADRDPWMLFEELDPTLAPPHARR